MAACKDIDRSKAELRPCVDREMTFLNDNHARHAMGREMMKGRINDGSTTCLGSPAQPLLNHIRVIEKLFVTAREFEKKVFAKCNHGAIVSFGSGM